MQCQIISVSVSEQASILARSNIVRYFQAVQEEANKVTREEDLLCMHGDGIYVVDSVLLHRHRASYGHKLSEREARGNRGISKMRISNKWGYGDTG
jgi:hypothetical protein